MYDHQYSQIYDLLHTDKAYSNEVQFVNDIYDKYADTTLSNILDVGCGTGNHLKYFANEHVSILGIDPSEEMIEVAKSKNIPNTDFIAGNITQLPLMDFYEMTISLFNVVNHIHDLPQLKKFFHAIYYRVKPGGIFVFD